MAIQWCRFSKSARMWSKYLEFLKIVTQHSWIIHKLMVCIINRSTQHSVRYIDMHKLDYYYYYIKIWYSWNSLFTQVSIDLFPHLGIFYPFILPSLLPHMVHMHILHKHNYTMKNQRFWTPYFQSLPTT